MPFKAHFNHLTHTISCSRGIKEIFRSIVINMEPVAQPVAVVSIAGDDEVASHHACYFRMTILTEGNQGFNLYVL